MSAIIYILDHADQAIARLPTQYVGMPNLTALARLSGDQAQEMEAAFEDMVQNDGLALAHDSLLDQIGDVVGQPRNGATDSEYKIFLYARITENVSKGTPETLIYLYKTLMSADKVYYNPVYPAAFSLTAVGSLPSGSVLFPPFSFSDDPDPDGQGFGDYDNPTTGGNLASANGFSAAVLTAIKAALNASRIAGVSIDYFATVLPLAFSFFEDPDPSGLGFGDATDSTVGGTLAEII